MKRSQSEQMEAAFKKKFIIVTVIIAVLAVIMVFVGIRKHKQQVAANQISGQLYKIRTTKAAMDQAQNTDDRISKLDSLEQNYQNYLQKKQHNSTVIKHYKNAINEGKTYFLKKTDQAIKANTATDLKKETRKSLKAKSAKLKKELKFIEAHQNVVYSKQDVTSYQKQINSLNQKYTNRLKKLKAQAKEKAAAASAAAVSSSEAARAAAIEASESAAASSAAASNAAYSSSVAAAAAQAESKSASASSTQTTSGTTATRHIYSSTTGSNSWKSNGTGKTSGTATQNTTDSDDDGTAAKSDTGIAGTATDKTETTGD